MSLLRLRAAFAIALTLFGVSAPSTALAQGSRADYARAASLAQRWRAARRPLRDRVRFMNDESGVWFTERSAGGTRYVRVGADGRRRAAATAKELGIDEEKDGRLPRSRRDRRRRRSRSARGPRAVAGVSVQIRAHNVWMREKGGASKPWVALTKDGTEADPYILPRHWAPSGGVVLGFRVSRADERVIHRVQSTPRDRVQPKLQSQRYRKPGDTIPQARPVLFDVRARKRIPVDARLFEDSYRVRFLHWSADSRRAYCLYNRRGHQQLALRAIDAASGAVTTIVDERSKTFVDYSQKTSMHFIRGGRELLWTSERDGHNHIYRFDAVSGELLAQLTKGAWVVRDIEHVDEAAGEVWFAAMGVHADQDPYHRHLARVRFDGGDFTLLTDADGDHEWRLSPSRKLLATRWSRVDHAPVFELRDARSGEKIVELAREDASGLVGAGFAAPQRFVAKGRDGKTDIHGLLIRPSTFEKGKRYPVLEDIYAGPHGHHVPKRFGSFLRQRKLAELGFIVVRIDGMGTNWRSKAFHDVCRQNLKDAGLPDRIAWMRAAARAHPELDLSRVGIFGGSAGGQNALSALLHHGDFYKAAVSDCGCHDNRMDKIWWNEAWMGKLGPHYADSSNVTHAHKLQGKLLLTVGELDKNVDPASTMQVVDALIRADKDFDLIVVPGGGHGVGERPYAARRRQDFFVRHLIGREPRW